MMCEGMLLAYKLYFVRALAVRLRSTMVMGWLQEHSVALLSKFSAHRFGLVVRVHRSESPVINQKPIVNCPMLTVLCRRGRQIQL